MFRVGKPLLGKHVARRDNVHAALERAAKFLDGVHVEHGSPFAVFIFAFVLVS